MKSIRERNLGLQKLENEINELNSMYNDLNKMLMDQSRLVDSIDNNVEHVRFSVNNTNSNLAVAKKDQVFVFFTLY